MTLPFKGLDDLSVVRMDLNALDLKENRSRSLEDNIYRQQKKVAHTCGITLQVRLRISGQS